MKFGEKIMFMGFCLGLAFVGVWCYLGFTSD